MTSKTADVAIYFAISGFALFFAWFTLNAFCLPLLADPSPYFPEHLAAHTCFFVGVLVGNAVIFAIPHNTRHGMFTPAAVLVLSACCISNSLYVAVNGYVQVHYGVLAFLSFLSGTAGAFLLATWHGNAMHIVAKSPLRYEGLSCAIGSGLVCLTLFAAPDAAWGYLSSLAIVASVVLFLLVRKTPAADAARHARAQRKLRRVSAHMDRRFRVLFFMLNFLFGLIWCIVIPNIQGVGISLGVACLCVVALLLATRATASVPDRYVVTLMRTCLGIAVLAFLIECVDYPLCYLISQCMFIASWLICWVVDSALLLEQAREFDFFVIEHSATSSLITNAGLFAGWCVGIVLIATGLIGAEHDRQLFVALAVVFALIGAWLIPHDAYASPDTVLIRQSEAARLGNAGQNLESTQPSIVQRMAGRYELTRREQDALEWLVKGRTAAAIAEKLDISESTAKTHIYNIYKKTGVHSQQELMNLIESI